MAEERGGEVITGTLEMIVLEILQRGPVHGPGASPRWRRDAMSSAG